ncbi:MAG: hypothetical protein R3E01_06965 [Pirellulaceae bacterium]
MWNLEQFNSHGEHRIVERLRGALEALYANSFYAADLKQDPWEFALHFAELRELGITRTDIQWLLHNEILHRRPTIDESKSVLRSATTTLSDLLFILSDKGCSYVSPISTSAPESQGDAPHLEPTDTQAAGDSPSECRPRWNRHDRELYYGDQLVKKFSVPAKNQELVLTAFEEEEWPQHIDSPLPPAKSGEAASVRLRDTIKRLNQGHQAKYVTFHGNGSGSQIVWHRIDGADTSG